MLLTFSSTFVPLCSFSLVSRCHKGSGCLWSLHFCDPARRVTRFLLLPLHFQQLYRQLFQQAFLGCTFPSARYNYQPAWHTCTLMVNNTAASKRLARISLLLIVHLPFASLVFACSLDFRLACNLRGKALLPHSFFGCLHYLQQYTDVFGAVVLFLRRRLGATNR